MGPVVPIFEISQELNFLIAFVIGLGFGFALEQAGFSSSRKLAGMFYGYDTTVLKVFFTAAITAMLGLVFLNYYGLIDMSIVYSIQIGAYTNFSSNLISDDITQLEEFEENGFNKFAIGKFTTYKEAVMLRDDLKRVGFKDCFIIAKSYGMPVDIKEALQLSGEKWIRGTVN